MDVTNNSTIPPKVNEPVVTPKKGGGVYIPPDPKKEPASTGETVSISDEAKAALNNEAQKGGGVYLPPEKKKD